MKIVVYFSPTHKAGDDRRDCPGEGYEDVFVHDFYAKRPEYVHTPLTNVATVVEPNKIAHPVELNVIVIAYGPTDLLLIVIDAFAVKSISPLTLPRPKIPSQSSSIAPNTLGALVKRARLNSREKASSASGNSAFGKFISENVKRPMSYLLSIFTEY